MSEENLRRQKPEVKEKSPEGPPAAKRLGELRARTLVVLGAEGIAPILEIGEVLAREIPGTGKMLIPEVAHHLPLEKPEEFNRIILNSLRQHVLRNNRVAWFPPIFAQKSSDIRAHRQVAVFGRRPLQIYRKRETLIQPQPVRSPVRLWRSADS
ncbi:MAG: alpha/beta hydrolase [Coprothermobacterota bacterium]|nr:alpha/beta hydrolase [Coprothermobacterota bacterium]